MRQQLTIYSNPHQFTSPKIAKALARCTGGRIVYDDSDPIGGWAGFGDPANWGSLQKAIRLGMPWYYGDHSYFHHGRKRFFRFTKNAFQHTGIGQPNYHRLADFFTSAAPFKKEGRYILICLHSENFHLRVGAPLPSYLEALEAKIRMFSDREIVVRSKQSETKFHDELKGAWAVVTHSSACAIEALMRGVPAFCTADCAASLFALREPINVERPLYPSEDERMHWAGVLAANQWTLEEIQNGTMWRQIHAQI